MAESKMPAKIGVGQHTGWAAVHTAKMKGDTVYIRADLVEPLVEALRAHDAYMAENFSDGPDSKALHPKAATNWKRIRAALSSWEAAQ